MCKIAVLERFTLLGSGIASILSNEKECEVVLAKTKEELVRKLDDSIPDVIVIDIIHNENSGFKPIKRFRRIYPHVPVLLIVSASYADCFEEYIRLGVKGFIFNSSDRDELRRAIKKLMNGGEYFTDKVWKIFKSSIQTRKHKPVHQKLTDREVAVLKLFSSGLTYKEIGSELSISPRTVETHKRNILSKLKINSTADMVKYAYRNNILI
ncbi:helix-turn-helix transcriptional regulator [Maribellus sediminis]|uniref:helix-turn-helix transcriptional regulator n=1 Tax=Maribellus sediminis TaxID=2696285 RepID=UPI00143202DD|nr:response regulator transcription factor [Maribellus sediminis]